MRREVFAVVTRYNHGLRLVFKLVKNIFPQVDKELKYWAAIPKNSGDEILARQALLSIRLKRFHAQGGSVYALYPGTNPIVTVKFIVAFQTISDYLDNLCDRANVKDESAFRQLHLSMLDAVDPERDVSDYYKYYPYKNDTGYLIKLVKECRSQVSKLPSYSLVIDTIKKYVHLYSDLQAYKHLSSEIREKCVETWANYYLKKDSIISCWEFSAAAGSTLGIFALFSAANNPSLTIEEVAGLEHAYFPWICGLHILLDYYIDAQEDLQMGDLNFTYYYKNLKQCEERLLFFFEHSLEHCKKLSYPKFHMTIVKGLPAMYLSDPKASLGMNDLLSKNILENCCLETRFYYKLCKIMRRSAIL